MVAAWISPNNGLLPPGQYVISADASGSGTHGPGGSYTLTFTVSPVPFQVMTVTSQTNDVLLSWPAYAGTTNVVQATSGAADGSYSNNFVTISPAIIIPVPGTNTTGIVSTNYLDSGGATNFSSRYYRIGQ